MNIEEIGQAALGAILDGTRVTLSLKHGGKWPKGWPRGDLMSESALGKNVSFDPVKILLFLQRNVRQTNSYKETHDGVK